MSLQNKNDLSEAEKKIGYVFKNKIYLTNAFTHSSFSNENKSATDYERLEFLGDAVLNLSVGLKLYSRFPDTKEGVLTRKRASLVSADMLSEIIDEYGLISYMRVGTGHVSEDVLHSKNVKCDLFESIVGAIFLDSNKNFDETEKFIWNKLEKYIDKPQVDFKSKTLEYFAKKKIPYTIETLRNDVPCENFFISHLIVDGNVLSEGTGKSKSSAEKMACKNFYEKLFG